MSWALVSAIGIPSALAIGAVWFFVARLQKKLAEAEKTIATQAALILDYAKDARLKDAQIAQLVDRSTHKPAADKLRAREF